MAARNRAAQLVVELSWSLSEVEKLRPLCQTRESPTGEEVYHGDMVVLSERVLKPELSKQPNTL